MRHTHQSAADKRQAWQEQATRWLAMLWRCPCQYSNVATFRCYGCGSRPPRELRDRAAASPVH